MVDILGEIALMLIGLAGLVIASYFAVTFAKNLARAIGVSELMIGLTIAAIGTSLPEIFTNIQVGLSNLHGVDASGIGIGNIIGSCLANITLILGIGGFFATLRASKKSLFRDGIMVMFSTLILFLAASDGIITKLEGATLVMIYIIYVLFLLGTEKTIKSEKGSKQNIVLDIVMITIAFFAISFFSNMLVKYGILIAESYSIPHSIIGIFVGLGTSFPELAVSIVAIFRHSGQLSIGNILGSNITNSFVAAGIGAFVAPLIVSPTLINYDFLMMIIGTAIAILLLFNHLNLNRKESSVLILIYIMFILFKLRFFGV